MWCSCDDDQSPVMSVSWSNCVTHDSIWPVQWTNVSVINKAHDCSSSFRFSDSAVREGCGYNSGLQVICRSDKGITNDCRNFVVGITQQPQRRLGQRVWIILRFRYLLSSLYTMNVLYNCTLWLNLFVWLLSCSKPSFYFLDLSINMHQLQF